MRQPARRPQVSDSIPNLAPMVDVIMVLLIFFLMGASFDLLSEGMLQTELDPRTGPGAGASIEITPRIRIALSDRENGRSADIRVLDIPLPPGDFQALYDYLNQRRGAGADADNPVVIGADANVRWNFVVQAMDAAVRAGFKNVQFAVSMDEKLG